MSVRRRNRDSGSVDVDNGVGSKEKVELKKEVCVEAVLAPFVT